MLAAGGPAGEDDDLGDDDGVDADSLAGSLWGTRDWDTGAAAGPPGTGGQDCGPAGFGSGQPLDVARPGPALAGAADRVHTGALRRVSDEELTGMIRAWRRLSSWATARELGAIAEFARRRPDEDPGPGTDGDVARRARARRAASGPPGAAKQAGSAQGSAQAAQPGGANPAAQAAQPSGANPAAQGAPAGGTAGATSAVQGAPAASAGRVNPAAQGAPADGTAGANSAARGAPAAPAGGAGGATPAAQAAAAAPAGGVNPAAAAGAPAGGRPGTGPGFPEVISPFASYELSLALTLTGRSADAYLDFAVELATKLPETMAALEAGQIDIIRARIIAEATHVLSAGHTAAVEERIFPRAGQQTSGQLRAALARAVLAADPGAARARREEAQRDARVLRWREDAGTAALCGRDLPSADVLAADQRISARARDLRSAGVTGTLDELRARAYLDYLLGRDSMPPPQPSGQPGTAAPPGESPAGGPPAGGPQRAAPQRAAPRRAAPRRAAPRRAAPRRAAPQRAAPQRAAPQRAAPQRAAPQRAAPQRAAPQRAAPQRAAPQRAAPQRAAPQRAAPQQVNPPPPGCPRQPGTAPASPRGRPAGRRAAWPRGST